MSKTREALERAEKERMARKEQPLQVPIKTAAAKKFVHLILTTFAILIFGLVSFWAGSTGYLNRITDVARKNPRGIVAADPPAIVQSHVITSEEIFGVQILDFYQDTIQALEVSSRSEQRATPISQKRNNTHRFEDRKSDSISGQLLDTADSTGVTFKSADRPSDRDSRDQNGLAHRSQHSLKTSDAVISPGLTADSKPFDQKSVSVTPVISETPPVKEKDQSPDPGKLIDWVLKKRAMKHE